MSNAEPAAAPVDTTDADALALMRLVHLIEAVHHDRATSQLDLRQRLVIHQQHLERHDAVPPTTGTSMRAW